MAQDFVSRESCEKPNIYIYFFPSNSAHIFPKCQLAVSLNGSENQFEAVLVLINRTVFLYEMYRAVKQLIPAVLSFVALSLVSRGFLLFSFLYNRNTNRKSSKHTETF